MPSAYTFEEKPQPKTIENFASEIKVMAERIRKNVEELEIRLNDGRVVKATVSMGISFCHNRREPINKTVLLERADGALYKAKESGRNIICLDHESIKIK